MRRLEASNESAAPDADARDAQGPPPDSPATLDASDAGPEASDAGRDASDAGRDSGPDAADARDGGICSPVNCPPVKFECVPEAAATGGGLVVDTVFYVAFRFQVPAGRTLVSSEVGALIRPVTATGSMFAALIAMSGPTATLKAGLTPTDVVASAVINLAGGGIDPRVVSAPLTATLVPGWYALAFGTDKLGAAGAYASIVTLSTNGCTNGQHLISVRQTGENIAQSSAGYMYVLAQ